MINKSLLVLLFLGLLMPFRGFSTDSVLKPIDPSTLNIEVPKTTTMASPVSNEDYSQLPPCPGDPSTSPGVQPVCPDINGNYPPGKQPNCPLQCTVTRTEVTKPSGQWTRVLSSQDAICPAGYSEVGSWNIKPDIVTITWKDAHFPIPDQATMNDYASKGYICAPDPTTQNSFVYCGDYNKTPYVANQIQPINGNLGPGLGVYQTQNEPMECYYAWSSHDCSDSSITCSPKSDYNWKWNIYYSYIRCTAPASGLYYSPTTFTPASRVCAYDQDAWSTLNKPE